MPSDTAKIKICKAKICFNGPILFPQTYRKKSVNDEADIIVWGVFFKFKLQNSVFTERCIYCKKDHINRRCFVCAADLFNLLHVLCMIYLNSCSVLRHVEEDCWINGVQKCLYTQQVVSFILRTKQSRCNRNGYTQQSVTGHTVRGIYNTKGGAGVLSSLISEACHQRGYYTWREWWWGFGDNCDSPSPAQFFLGRKKMVYWWLYGTKETVKARFCSWRGSQKKKKRTTLFPWSFAGRIERECRVTLEGSRSTRTRRCCWGSRCRCRSRPTSVCLGLRKWEVMWLIKKYKFRFKCHLKTNHLEMQSFAWIIHGLKAARFSLVFRMGSRTCCWGSTQ